MKFRPKCALVACFAAALAFVGAAPDAVGQQDACWMTPTNASLQYLRRLSLDLRGHPPSVEEYEEVIRDGEVSETTIRGMLDSEGFVHQMREYHRDLLKLNIADQRYITIHWALSQHGHAWSLTYNNSMRFRGSRSRTAGEGVCVDVQVTPQDPIVTTRVGADGETYPVDGWVWVRPYWDPSTQIKVCAFDAQTEQFHDPSTRPDLYVGPNGQPYGGEVPEGTVDCSISSRSRGCGCGPNLEWCFSRGYVHNSEQAISRAIVEQSLQFVDSIVRRDRPYTDVILASDLPFNGPISHYINHWSFKADSGLPFIADRDQGYEIPDLNFADAEWVDVDRGADHAGILTSPFFLLKYATNRGRAAAFYDMFMCQSFTPPTGGLPPAGDPSNDEPNLTRRAGCDSCHRTVEPMAAHWGLFSENGLVKLGMDETNNVLFPSTSTYLEACDIGGCEAPYPWVCVDGSSGTRRLCRNSYQLERVSDGGEDGYQGMLKSFVFADVDPSASSNARCEGPDCGYVSNIQSGPSELASEAVENGTFASCVVSRMWERWIARPATTQERQDLWPWLIDGFSAGGYALKELVFHLVTSQEYRSATWTGGEP